MTGDGSAICQLSYFKSAEIHEVFENLFFRDWYCLLNANDVNDGITKMWELGGQYYDLPYTARPNGEGIFVYLVRLLLGELLTSLLFSLKPLQ